VRRAERGVVCISAMACSVRLGMGRGVGDDGEGEKLEAAARRESGRRLHEEGLARVGLCATKTSNVVHITKQTNS
jgi:hypothetical protein